MTDIPLNFTPLSCPTTKQLLEIADKLAEEVYIPRKFQGDMDTIVNLLRRVHDAGRARGHYESESET